MSEASNKMSMVYLYDSKLVAFLEDKCHPQTWERLWNGVRHN